MLSREVFEFVADSPTSTETNYSGTSRRSIRFSPTDTHEEFIDQRDRLPCDLRAFLTPHSPDDYISMEAELYLSDTKSSGFGIKPDGELISVFSLPGAHEGDYAVEAAIKEGAKYLDCLGVDCEEGLKTFYQRHGFKVVEEYLWNDEYRPEGWDEEKWGRPNAYVMELKNDEI